MSNVLCPICHKPGTLVNKVRKVTTAAGIGAGGYLAVSGSAKGAAIGTVLCPGLGTVLGGVLGCLLGAAAGGVAGNSVGKMVDENIIRIYQCPNGHEWRAA